MSWSGLSQSNPLRVLRFSDYKFIWSSEALSLWAIEMEIIVLAIFVLRDTDSPLLVGLIGALKFAGTLLGPLYGVVVDRFDRRILQIWVRTLNVLLAATLTTLVLSNSLELWHAYAIVALGSVFRMLDLVLVQTLTADSVPKESLHSAIGLSRSTLDGARVMGAIVGGTILETLGLDVAYSAITVLYLLATIAAFKVDRTHAPESVKAPSESVFTGIKQGLTHIRASAHLPGLIYFSFLVEFSAFPLVNGLMTVIGDEFYSLGGTGIGILAGIASGGALLGALFVSSRTHVTSPTRVLVIGSIVWHLVMLVLTINMPISAFGLLLFCWGFAGGATFVAMVVGLLRSTPEDLRGRVMGIRSLGIYGLPLGLLLAGWLAETFSARTMIGSLGAIGVSASIGAVLLWPALLRSAETKESIATS